MKRHVVLAALLVAAAASAEKIKLLSATVKDKAVPEANLTFQAAGKTSVKATSDASGVASFEKPPMGVDDSTVTLIIEKTGFSSLVVQCPCMNLTYAMSENMTRAGGIRVVLNWGPQPPDLDSHLAYGDQHIYFNAKKGDKANLDVDDTDGNGPETVTIDDWVEGKDYVYSVHNFTMKEKSGSKTFANSKAKVFVYKRNVQQRMYEVNPDGVGNLWVLFRIDKDGTFHDINRYADVSQEGAVGAFTLKDQFTKSSAPVAGVVGAFKDVVLKKGPALVELGWSNKGRFAYVTFDYRSGQPCVTVGVQDLVTDASLLSEKQCGPHSSGKTPASVDDWQLVDGIEAKLQGLDIQPVSRPLGRFPVDMGGGEKLDVKVKADELVASSSKKGSKILGKISDISAKAEQKDVGIEGYFKSPFEERVAVLYAVPVNKEGGYDYIVKVSGFHLKVGFKK